jgi:hypothetical protein
LTSNGTTIASSDQDKVLNAVGPKINAQLERGYLDQLAGARPAGSGIGRVPPQIIGSCHPSQQHWELVFVLDEATPAAPRCRASSGSRSAFALLVLVLSWAPSAPLSASCAGRCVSSPTPWERIDANGNGDLTQRIHIQNPG